MMSENNATMNRTSTKYHSDGNER